MLRSSGKELIAELELSKCSNGLILNYFISARLDNSGYVNYVINIQNATGGFDGRNTRLERLSFESFKEAFSNDGCDGSGCDDCYDDYSHGLIQHARVKLNTQAKLNECFKKEGLI